MLLKLKNMLKLEKIKQIQKYSQLVYITDIMKYTEAEEILRPILAKNKRDVEGIYELGYSLFKQERYEEAQNIF